MRRRLPLLIVGLLLSLPVLTGLARAQGFVVIVHPDVAVDHISRDDLQRIYTKTMTRWPDGTPVVPVELGGVGPTRDMFYSDTMQTAVADIANFWITQAMTSGQRPPRMFPSEPLVVKFVADTPGAVGFVSDASDIDSRVKQIPIR